MLDEGDEEVLINPNMLENERHRRNVETRKSGKAGTRPWEEEDTIDEFTGEVVRPSMLSKYDGGLDGEGKKKETFRLGRHYGIANDLKLSQIDCRHLRQLRLGQGDERGGGATQAHDGGQEVRLVGEAEVPSGIGVLHKRKCFLDSPSSLKYGATVVGGWVRRIKMVLVRRGQK